MSILFYYTVFYSILLYSCQFTSLLSFSLCLLVSVAISPVFAHANLAFFSKAVVFVVGVFSKAVVFVVGVFRNFSPAIFALRNVIFLVYFGCLVFFCKKSSACVDSNA